MHDFTVIILEGAYATSVAATVDILSAARELAPRTGAPIPRWRVCSVGGGAVRLQSDFTIGTGKLPKRSGRDASTWVVPGLGWKDAEAIRANLARTDVARVARAIAGHVRAGGAVAASCSAVFVLQLAGVLRGRCATTSWWLAPILKRMAPDCKVDADRMVCADGVVVTAGAAFAQTDLMLHLVRQRFGSALADAVSRTLLLDGRETQAAFVVPEVLANGDEFVARLAARVESALPRVASVAALAEEFAVSERTLSRRVHRATGKSALALVQAVRLRKARSLLESSRLSVEQIAEAVGYRDATALRRLMKKLAGAGPSRYRPAIAVNRSS